MYHQVQVKLKCSKIGMDLSVWGASAVNCMLEVNRVDVLKESWCSSAFQLTNLSSKYLKHILGGLVAVLMALVSNSSND